MYRTRRIGASILAVLTAILLLLTTIGWWADRYLLDSQRFTDSANEILDEKDVQEALAVAITDQISKAAGRDLQIVRPFISSIVTGLVDSDQFQDIFDAAVFRVHDGIIGGKARDAVLNLTEVVDRVRDAIEPIAPNIADEIPEGEQLRLRLLDETQVNSFYEALDLIKDVVIVLTVLTVLCFAAALALSPRRWRTLALTGWVVVGLFAVRMLAQWIGRGVVGGLSDVPEYSSAAESAYRVVLHGLAVQTVVVIVLGLAVALFAGWTDRHGGWAGVTAAVGRGWAWAKAQVPKRTPAPAPATAEVGTGAATTVETAATVEAAAEERRARAAVEGVLATRLPEPRTSVRTTHWWRAAGLLVLGLFAVLSPGSLTTVVVVLLGVAAIYLAVTEAVAAWGTPATRDPDEVAADAEDSSADPEEPAAGEAGPPTDA